MLDLQRRLHALEQVAQRELKSLETAQLKQQRIHARRGHDHMPALILELKPPGRRAAPHKAKNRYISALARELAEAFDETRPSGRRPVDLSEDFRRAAGGDGHSSGPSEGIAPRGPTRPRRAPRRRRDRDQGRER